MTLYEYLEAEEARLLDQITELTREMEARQQEINIHEEFLNNIQSAKWLISEYLKANGRDLDVSIGTSAKPSGPGPTAPQPPAPSDYGKGVLDSLRRVAKDWAEERETHLRHRF